LRALDRRPLFTRNRTVGHVGALLRKTDIGEGHFAPALSTALHDDPRIDAEEEHQAEDDQETDNADAAAPASTTSAAARERKAEAAAALASPIFDVLALSLTTPAHCLNSSCRGRERPAFSAHNVHAARGYTRPGSVVEPWGRSRVMRSGCV
jgi:hypothetical protein